MGYACGTNWTIEIVREEVMKVKQILNLDRMPTSKEVRQVGKSGLDGAISSYGGYKFLSDKFSLSMKKPTIDWSDKLIEESIIKVKNALNLDRMPSKSEIERVEGNYQLHNAIAHGYGYYEWAKRLNLTIKESETLLGVKYQDVCFNELTKLGYKVEHTAMKAPYDLLVNDGVRIDVKSGCAYMNGSNRAHTFGINKEYPTCDLYIIYALDETGKNIERTFIIPASFLHIKSTMSIGSNSKYDKYINQWKYIDLYTSFYSNL